jgi:hypothetical protein
VPDDTDDEGARTVTAEAAITLLASAGAVLHDAWPHIEADSDARLAAASMAELLTALVADRPDDQRRHLDQLRAIDRARS